MSRKNGDVGRKQGASGNALGTEIVPPQPGIGFSRRARRPLLAGMVSLVLGVMLSSPCLAQNGLPFAVSNPGHQKWSAEEASRIYDAACTLVARTIRPERPPLLHPKFVLVLGATDNEVVRTGPVAEIHLKSWDQGRFAEGVAILVAREVLQPADLRIIAQESLRTALASASVAELRGNR